MGVVLGKMVSCSGGDGDDERKDTVSVRISPVRVESADPADAPDRPSTWALFDRDTAVGWSPPSAPPGSPTRVRVALGRPTPITHLKIFGASPYVLAVRTGDGAALGGLEHVRLDALGAGWNALRLPDATSTDELVLELARTGGDAAAPAPIGEPISEIELWGVDQPAPMLDADKIGELAKGALSPALAPPGVDVLAATATDAGPIDLAPGSQAGAPACGQLRFSLARSPASYRRAWLVYAADGAFRSFVLTRSLNAAAMRRGQWFSAGAGPAPLVDPIDPETLALGDNHYDVCLPADASSHVTLHDAFFVGELDRGNNDAVSIARGPVDGAATDAANELLDPGNAAPVTVHPGERLVVAMDRWVSPDAVLLRHATGTWAIDCLDDGGHAREVEPTDIVPGADRTLIALTEDRSELACTAIALRPTGGQAASLASVSVIGSGARARIDWPKITLASPAEHFGHVAWVDGWASAPSALGGPAGPAGVTAIEVQTTDMGATHGVFGSLLSRTDDVDKPWPVAVTARFADGSAFTRTFLLDRQGGSLEPRGPTGLSEAQKAEHFGTPGQSATETVDARADATSIRLGTDVGVDVPGGAVTGKLDVTVKHLAKADLPPLDPGLVNVTAPDAHGFEFLPHGQKFKQPVDILVPFDPALLPPGYVSDDVHSYYFDTETQHWRRLSRARVDDKQHIVHSASDHFTSIIDAVVVAPESPELRQFNPNAISGIKAADPGAGIRLIDPPAPGPRGDASLGYPFGLPPGRRGLTPQLALSYNSSRGNGWVGVGWDLPIRTIAVDTRFGAARYDCDLETETYDLDGEQLTPIAHRGPVKRRTDDTTSLGGETVKIFHARVEGGFQKIIRHGADTKHYWWEVIDKAGTRSFFGGTPESGGPIAQATMKSTAGHIFEWALVEVRDLHGNAIRYEHELATSVGFAGGSVPGVNLYPTAIRYTFEPGAHRGETGTRLISEEWRTVTLAVETSTLPMLLPCVIVQVDSDGWPHDHGRRGRRGSMADTRARPGTRGTLRCRHVTCCDALCDVQRPGRGHVSSTGTDANRWSQ